MIDIALGLLVVFTWYTWCTSWTCGLHAPQYCSLLSRLQTLLDAEDSHRSSSTFLLGMHWYDMTAERCNASCTFIAILGRTRRDDWTVKCDWSTALGNDWDGVAKAVVYNRPKAVQPSVSLYSHVRFCGYFWWYAGSEFAGVGSTLLMSVLLKVFVAMHLRKSTCRRSRIGRYNK